MRRSAVAAQRDDRIDRRGAARGNQSSEQRHQRQEQRHRGKRPPVKRCDAVEQRRQQPRRRDSCGCAGDDRRGRQAADVGEDADDDIGATRADGQSTWSAIVLPRDLYGRSDVAPAIVTPGIARMRASASV